MHVFYRLYIYLEEPLCISRWSCLVGWQTWATPVTWMPRCSACAPCRSSKPLLEGEFSASVGSQNIIMRLPHWLCGQHILKCTFSRRRSLNLCNSWLLSVCLLLRSRLSLQVCRCSAIFGGQCTVPIHHGRYEARWTLWNERPKRSYGVNMHFFFFCLYQSSALRDLYETMEKTSSSLPPIILLQFLHMAFPQFAEKGDQGQYLQQVRL